MSRFIQVFLFSLLSLSLPAQDYFPLVAGSQWVYRGSFGGESLSIKVGSERQLNGRTYHEVQGYTNETLLVRQPEPGIYVYWDEKSKQDALLINFDGLEYASPSSECQQQGKAEGRALSYEGPLGKFDNAKEIRFFGGVCADAGTTKEVYVPNAGMVRRSVTSFTGERNFDLVYAQIGGVTYLSDAQVSFGISVTVLSPEQLAARLVLTNKSGRDIVLEFPSGQRYDFQVKDARGEVVYTWSATRLFPAVLGQVTVKDELVWIETFSAGILRPGQYSLEGRIANSDPKRYSSSVGFEVR
jgi:hypothetical protein